MIRHVVTFTWIDGTTADDVAEITARLRGLTAVIPELRSYAVGPDLGIGGTADFAIVADFDDVAGYEAYRDHPEHEVVRSTVIMPRVAARSAVQYEVPNPS